MIAAIYARKSNTQDVADDQKSVARQIDHARAYAERKGWTVDDRYLYVDDGITGAEFVRRPAYVRLMIDVVQKPRAPFDVLVMSEESRLGREQIETAYALKQIVGAGVKVFCYLEDRERTLDSPTEKMLMALTAFADELEREKVRQRVIDALSRKARAGHVAGGRVFGYDNVPVCDASGRRSHVELRINEAEAVVVVQIFTLCAEGLGVKAIAHRLNTEGATCPRPRRAARPAAWAVSSVRAVLSRETYRGRLVWNRTRKQARQDRRKDATRPASDWVTVDAPQLRVVTDAQWTAAHRRLEMAAQTYAPGRNGQLLGRPPT
jgi:site-specific DNA recombinase